VKTYGYTDYTTLQAFKNAVATSNLDYRYSSANCNLPSTGSKDKTWIFQNARPGYHRRFWVDPPSFQNNATSTHIVTINGLVETSILPSLEDLHNWKGFGLSKQRCSVDLASSRITKGSVRHGITQLTEQLDAVHINATCTPCPTCEDSIIAASAPDVQYNILRDPKRPGRKR